VLSNVQLAFGAEKKPAELLQIAKENYTHYALTGLEWIQSITWSRQDFLKRTECHWADVQQRLKEGEGGLLLTSHLGNWEYAIQSASAHGMPCDVIVKRQGTRIAQDFLEWFRTRFGAGVIYESGTTRDIFGSLARKRLVVFVLDQFMGPPIGLPVKFFKREAGTAVGLALITEKRKNSLFMAYSYREPSGKIQVHIEALPEPQWKSETKVGRLYERTQWFNDQIEVHVRRFPEQWLWLHRRWKPFKGEPRWKMASACFALILTALLAQGCSSTKMAATPTGIEIPPDPTISVPAYGQSDSTEESVEAANEEKRIAPGILANKKEKKLPVPVKKKPVASGTPFSIVPVDKVPFEMGEQMVVDLTWLSLPAGKGVLEVREGPTIQGRPTFHLWGNVLSSKMVDTIYHVDNTIESFIDKSGFIPYKFLLSMFETAQKKETRVVFDHPNSKALYWSKRISQKWGNQDVDRTDAIIPRSRDMFSALYYARALNYELNKKQQFYIYENGQNLSIEALPIAKEVVTSKAGVFQCWKIKVDVKLDNVLRPTGDLYMWLSDDSKKYLVKFDAKVKIGSLLGRLESVRERS